MDEPGDPHALTALLADRRSGASEIESALRGALAAVAGRDEARVEAALEEITEAVVERFPCMAPLVCLLDEAWAAWRSGGAPAVARLAREGRTDELPAAPAQLLAAAGGRLGRVLTLSRSGTVLAALRTLTPAGGTAGEGLEVLLGEGRPEGEGEAMAADLRAAGYRVAVVVDAALPALAAGHPAPPGLREEPDRTAVLLGCDSVGPGGFVNKVGSYALARAAAEAGTPVLVLGGLAKLVPADLPLPWERETAAASGAERLRFDFERVPLALATRFLLAGEALGPEALARRLAALPPFVGEVRRRLEHRRAT